MNIISLVSYSFLPARTGGQKGIALFYKYFSRHHTVTCICTENNQPAFADGYEALNIISDSKLRYLNPMLFFTLRNEIRKKKATHVILEHPYYGWLGFLLKKFCGIKLVVHSHNIEGNRWKSLGKWWWRILWTYEKFTHRHADYNFFIQETDKQYAIAAFGLDEKKCLTVLFGTEIPAPPSLENHRIAGERIRKEWEIPEKTQVLLFNGAFKYSPNREALDNLLYRINPFMLEKEIEYRILIIGLDIPAAVMEASYPNVLVLGFMEDLELYLTGCDVFLNPVRTGGGIKTKLVEALAYNLTAVSTQNGAIGINPVYCGEKLLITPDHNWSLFANAIVRATEVKTNIPADFFQQFYWENITLMAAKFIIVNG